MRALRYALVLVAAAVVLTPAAGALPASPHVAIFFYPWYGAPTPDGGYQQWQQNGHTPPLDLYSAYYPASGAYSSSNPRLLDRQMSEIAHAGVDEVVSSWWGWGSPTDDRLAAVIRAAHRAHLAVAIHIEPYPSRTPGSVAGDIVHLAALGVTDFYVYDAELSPAGEWAAMRQTLPPVRIFAQTGHVGFAAAGKFDGVYTYDIVTYDGDKFVRYCDQAHRMHLLCAPSVGPGYNAIRADGDVHVKSRRAGATYDAMWTAALHASPDVVTITSFNEWGEGTQIEPARDAHGYRSYDGAWGLTGKAAQNAYLTRTRFWVDRLDAVR
jgi:glycoprotein endo-alpha-1,2-mannosidase